ncbi:hypothetical protein GOM49_12940 [Clostridium bovifaecis]|uniref:YheC/YheD family protein n=1 Tax=Clostridium bovifaecis TaxID=2184719 RepID=A0A6I6FDE0_9CLOT|nr:hypothetical protein GOM49_12940 [Clostridium bovifaecis]
MWVNIEVSLSDLEIIYLPLSLSQSSKELVYIHFGKNLCLTRVEYLSTLKVNVNNSFENPFKLIMTKALKDKLLIPHFPIYQLKIFGNEIIIGPVIGLLLGNHAHLYSPSHMRKYSDRFGIYNKIGGLIYAFSPKNIDWEKNSVYGLYYNVTNSKWEFGEFPLPTVIYRRNFHTEEKTIQKLIKATNYKLFNSYRFTKYEMNEYVIKDKQLCNHLIPTILCNNFDSLKSFIDIHNRIILKPTDLSRGRGICIIDKKDIFYKIIDYRGKTPLETLIKDEKELKEYFNSNHNFFNNYLAQKHINLAKVDGSVYDIRVVMQKKTKDDWVCSGIECRIAPSSSLITNISRGGYALSLHDALEKSFSGYPNIKLLMLQVDEFSKKLCIYMDKMGHHFAEFGIDLAFDEIKNLWLIEINVFPSFKGFKIFDYSTYLNIRYTPLLYAATLTEFKDSILVSEGSRE